VHVEGVTFVVDALWGVQPVMDPFTGLEVLETVPVSQAVRVAWARPLSLVSLSWDWHLLSKGAR
jgi:hypothetical protein